MKLPTIDHAVYEVKLLSRKELTKFRPFLVKEQKILMMAKESDDLDSMVKALKQIAKNCIIDDVNVDDLPMVDLEWLFLNLKARSSGEIQELYYKCTNDITANNETKACGMIVEVAINLLQIPLLNQNFNSRIDLNSESGIQFKLPTFEALNLTKDLPEEDQEHALVAECIDIIWDKDSVYKAKEATKEELLNFVEQIPLDKYGEVEKLFKNLPQIKQTITQVCPKCAYNHEFVLEGLEDFFI